MARQVKTMKNKIIYLLENKKENWTISQWAEYLQITAEEYKNFIKIINQLEEEGTVYISKNGNLFLAEKLNIYKGKIKSVKKYYATCVIQKGYDEIEIEIEKENLNYAYQNDIVRVKLIDNHTGKVLEILSHDLWHLVCEFKNHSFVYEDRFFPYQIQVEKDKSFHLVEGHLVLLKIKKYEGRFVLCKIQKIIGHHNDPGIDIMSCILKSNVPYEFSENFIKQTNDYIDKIPFSLKNRIDLRQELVCTIDGKDAKDLDDAISLKILENGNYQLGVHIADVSYYVQEKTFLDKEAFSRGTSIYLADRVIPMLPHLISNGVCSLQANQDKLTITCQMEIDFTGEIINYDIFPSVICSSYRLTYEEVNHLFHNENDWQYEDKKLTEMLFLMRNLSSILKAKMLKRGYLSLDITEAKLVMDENSHQNIKIEKRVQDVAEQLIENFMIAANETVASHIFYQQLPFIYRIHPVPSSEKIAGLANSLKDLQILLPMKSKTFTSGQLQKILNETKNSENESVVSQLILRSLSKAKYSVENVGHFGLGSKVYTHFTSPIRRYPDLIVHRYLRKYLFEQDYDADLDFLILAAENSSACEKRAMFLERDVEDMKKAEFMQNFIGCIYEGIVSGVMDFGVFVELENTCEGLMRYETIKDDFHDFSYFKSQFKLGSKVIVKVISTNIQNGEINFAFIKSKVIQKGGKKYGKQNYRHK